MSARFDMTGKKIGLWAVSIPVRGTNPLKWYCRCKCGKLKKVYGMFLRNGRSLSCGCLREDKKRIHGHTRHGLPPSRTYGTWAAMIQRCSNPRNLFYKNYGGRGIKVCDKWHNFQNFLADMGEKPKGLTIERVDNDNGYCPENCIWADWIVQAKNKRKRKSKKQ